MQMKVYTLRQAACFLLTVVILCAFAAIWLDRLVKPVQAIEVFAGETFSVSMPIELEIEVIKPARETKEAKKVLIYHTHTYEAYEPTPDYTYTATEKWRTANQNCNIVRVGKELAALLSTLGYEVTHDTQAYEPPNLSSSYTRSLLMLEKRLEAGEYYDLHIDLHRDAYSESMKNNNVINIAGNSVAKLMLLIGKGSGQSFLEKPEWEKNLAIAQSLTDDLNAQANGLCRQISLKTGRFNQHIAPRCVLIEVGNNKNTMEEALASLPYLADAIHNVLEILPEREV